MNSCIKIQTGEGRGGEGAVVCGWRVAVALRAREQMVVPGDATCRTIRHNNVSPPGPLSHTHTNTRAPKIASTVYAADLHRWQKVLTLGT